MNRKKTGLGLLTILHSILGKTTNFDCDGWRIGQVINSLYIDAYWY